MCLGRWERAMAVAPCVGVEYWRDVCRRGVKSGLTGASEKEEVDSEGTRERERGVWEIVGGLVEELISSLLSAQDYPTAYLVAQAHSEGLYDRPTQENDSTTQERVNERDELVKKVAFATARMYSRKRQWKMAAAVLVGVDEYRVRMKLYENSMGNLLIDR